MLFKIICNSFVDMSIVAEIIIYILDFLKAIRITKIFKKRRNQVKTKTIVFILQFYCHIYVNEYCKRLQQKN